MFSGCSITYGDELENPEKDRFSKNHVNIARCGLSNDMIVMRTIEYIEQNPDVDYVVTQFTVPRSQHTTKMSGKASLHGQITLNPEYFISIWTLKS